MSRWKRIPKVELHCHLEGTIRPNTLMEEAERHEILVPSEKTELRKHFYVDEQVENLMAFLEIFDRQSAIFKDKETITRVAREAVIDNFEAGVRLFELRYAPSFIQDAGKTGLSFEQIHDAVKTGVKEGKEICQDKGGHIYIGLIYIAISAMGRRTVEDTVSFLLKNQKDFIGFDIAGIETMLIDHQDLITDIDEAGISITFHCGEQPNLESVKNVGNAIKLRAKRIGHGVNVYLDPDVYELAKTTDTHLELCPISNVRTNAIDHINNHPIKKYLDDGLNVSVNTDGPAPMAIDCNIQFELLHQTFNFGIPEFFKLARNALRSSFAPQSEKDRLLQEFFSEVVEAELLSADNHEA